MLQTEQIEVFYIRRLSRSSYSGGILKLNLELNIFGIQTIHRPNNLLELKTDF